MASTLHSLSRVFLLLLLVLPSSLQLPPPLSPSDLHSLLDIRRSLRPLPGSTFFSSWDFSSPSPCSSFSGVSCSPDPSSPPPLLCVSLLSLGTGLASSPGLSGTLPSSIANFTCLTQLIVNPGRISGPIPPELGLNCHRLRLLSISNNLISGPVPDSLADLPDLHTLDLAHNQLSGPIPASFFSSSSARSLRFLILSSNKLSGVLPASLQTSSLLHLDLSRNDLAGVLPPLPPTLRYLAAAENSFSGTINAAFSSELSNLTYIDLSMNKLVGKIPTGVFALPQLSSIFLQRNIFYGPLIMPECVPASWEVVDLSHNMIIGQVPAELAAARSLFLNSNKLTGGVPREIAQTVYNGSMSTFYAQHNFLSEFPLPEAAGLLPEAVSLCLAYNCMELPASTEAGCPASAGTQQARPREQCPNDG